MKEKLDIKFKNAERLFDLVFNHDFYYLQVRYTYLGTKKWQGETLSDRESFIDFIEKAISEDVDWYFTHRVRKYVKGSKKVVRDGMKGLNSSESGMVNAVFSLENISKQIIESNKILSTQ